MPLTPNAAGFRIGPVPVPCDLAVGQVAVALDRGQRVGATTLMLHQDCFPRAVLPDIEFSSSNAASLRAAMAAERARLTALQATAHASERDLAWFTGRLALVRARAAAATPAPEPRIPTAKPRDPA